MINGKTLYSKLSVEDVSEYVLLTGDPGRADMMSKYLDDCKHIAFAREFNTYTGFYKGVRVTVSSCGMGSPSAIEMLEELYDCGAKVVVRWGTSSPYNDDNFGKFLIANSGWAEDDVSLNYAPANYPIVVDHRLVECLEESVKVNGCEYSTGIVKSYGGGLAARSLTKFGERRRELMPYYKTIKEEQQWGKYYGLNATDMESAAIIKVGNLMGIVVGSICLASVIMDRSKKLMHTDPENFIKMQEKLCLVALDGIKIFAEKYGNSI